MFYCASVHVLTGFFPPKSRASSHRETNSEVTEELPLKSACNPSMTGTGSRLTRTSTQMTETSAQMTDLTRTRSLLTTQMTGAGLDINGRPVAIGD